jgi:hypothetical protein
MTNTEHEPANTAADVFLSLDDASAWGGGTVVSITQGVIVVRLIDGSEALIHTCEGLDDEVCTNTRTGDSYLCASCMDREVRRTEQARVDAHAAQARCWDVDDHS